MQLNKNYIDVALDIDRLGERGNTNYDNNYLFTYLSVVEIVLLFSLLI
jgi:hypothetical protein